MFRKLCLPRPWISEIPVGQLRHGYGRATVRLFSPRTYLRSLLTIVFALLYDLLVPLGLATRDGGDCPRRY
jgi:hypothetical protein